MHIKYVIQVVGRVSKVITYVKSLWLMAQNLKEVFSSFKELTTLKDSGHEGVTSFPLSLGFQQPSSNMVAKLVDEISMDAVMPEEIICQINMVSGGYVSHPASVPVPEAVENPLTE